VLRRAHRADRLVATLLNPMPLIDEAARRLMELRPDRARMAGGQEWPVTEDSLGVPA
jgi:hypothetical protein